VPAAIAELVEMVIATAAGVLPGVTGVDGLKRQLRPGGKSAGARQSHGAAKRRTSGLNCQVIGCGGLALQPRSDSRSRR